MARRFADAREGEEMRKGWLKGWVLALFLVVLVVIQFIPGEPSPDMPEAPEASP
jgi:hypothetical protein